MDEGTPHVAPEVIITVAILIEESQSAPNHCVHHCHPCPGHMVLIHHLHPHALPERVLHALCHLAITKRGGGINHTWCFPSPNTSENSFPHRHPSQHPALPKADWETLLGRDAWEWVHQGDGELPTPHIPAQMGTRILNLPCPVAP